MPEDDKTQPTRREAFIKLGVGSVAVACAGAAVFGYSYLSPNVLYEPSPIANAGKPEHYPRGSVTQNLEAGIYIVHGPEGFYALSATCTHLGCLTAWNADRASSPARATAANSASMGAKLEGPAPRGLPWLKVWLSDEGELLVDRATIIPPKQYLRT